MTDPRIPPTTDADWDDETRALVEGLGRMNIFATNGAATSISTTRTTWDAITNVTLEPEPAAVPSTA